VTEEQSGTAKHIRSNKQTNKRHKFSLCHSENHDNKLMSPNARRMNMRWTAAAYCPQQQQKYQQMSKKFGTTLLR
jgi:hypothetical protein